MDITRPVWAEAPAEKTAKVIPLPVERRVGRVVRPVVLAPAQRTTDADPFVEFYSYDPGPLARALMAMAAADGTPTPASASPDSWRNAVTCECEVRSERERTGPVLRPR